jgi:CRISPR/Cas system endoribonuclease Cas6 (RAMP superfamily)
LGHQGLRPGGRYELLRAEVITPTGPVLLADASHGLLRQPKPSAAHDYLDATSRPVTRCTLRFATPLRIKEGNHFVTNTPSYAQLLHRTLGRVEQLAYAAGESSPLTREARTSLLAEAQRVEVSKTCLSNIQIQRRSARTLQQMQFSGLTGTVEYRGTMALTLPWLKLATLTQVGGKTAFGFGVIDILELKEE